MLVELLNMHPADYKRFLNFLRKHECQVPFERFRSARLRPRAMTEEPFNAARLAEATPPGLTDALPIPEDVSPIALARR